VSFAAVATGRWYARQQFEKEDCYTSGAELTASEDSYTAHEEIESRCLYNMKPSAAAEFFEYVWVRFL
jgi:hypothetical protein